MIDLYGDEIPGALVKTHRTGIENIESATGATFDELLESFVTRNFISAAGLNSDPTLNYGSRHLTDPTTGERVMPPVAEHQIACPRPPCRIRSVRLPPPTSG